MTSQANNVRIISGHLRSRKISFLDNEDLRPTGDRVRETLFNWLQNEIYEAECLDLFAGSGILGIEALSRGAKRVLFVEKDQRAAARLIENLETLSINGNSSELGQVFTGDALSWLTSKNNSDSYNLVFLDPPFKDEILIDTCVLLEQSSLLAKNSLVYLEHSKPLNESALPLNWTKRKEKQAGSVYFYLYERQAD